MLHLKILQWLVVIDPLYFKIVEMIMELVVRDENEVKKKNIELISLRKFIQRNLFVFFNKKI